MKQLTEIDRLFNIWLKYYPTEKKSEPEYNKQVTLDIKKIHCRKVTEKNKILNEQKKIESVYHNFMENMLSKNLLEEKSSEIIFSEENVIEKKESNHVIMTEKDFIEMETANKNRRKKRKNKFKELLGK